jgi:eukaryotic-like serine/threonine-protein kinase
MTHFPSRFRIYETMNHDGQSKVHKAWDEETQQWVALKQSSVCQREAQVLECLAEMPGLPRVVDCTENWLALGWIEGIALSHYILSGPLSEQASIAVIQDLLDILRPLHEHGWAHGDLTLSNIILTETGVHIIDWGCAHHESEPPVKELHGTIHYMAPELFENGGVPHLQSDYYALGVMLYEMLTRQMPFEGVLKVQVIASHHRHDRIPLSEVVPGIDASVEACFEALTARKPELREVLIESEHDPIELEANY